MLTPQVVISGWSNTRIADIANIWNADSAADAISADIVVSASLLLHVERLLGGDLILQIRDLLLQLVYGERNVNVVHSPVHVRVAD